jgi:hypothetical protein
LFCVAVLSSGVWLREYRWMKWLTAVGHVRRLAEQCVEMAELPSRYQAVPVSALWAVGDVLGTARDLDWVKVALIVDLPVSEVPWFCTPDGAAQWSEATRLSKNPVGAWWRSAHAPIWNHRIVRPVLIWDRAGGVREESLAALRDGRGAELGQAAPTADEFAARMADELAVSRTALVARTADYDAKRWGRTRLEKIADPLFEASLGYLDVLEAHPGM